MGKELKPSPLAGVDALLAKLDRALATPVSGDVLERVFPRDQLDHLDVLPAWEECDNPAYFNRWIFPWQSCPDPDNCEEHASSPKNEFYYYRFSDNDEEYAAEMGIHLGGQELYRRGFFTLKRVIVD